MSRRAKENFAVVFSVVVWQPGFDGRYTSETLQPHVHPSLRGESTRPFVSQARGRWLSEKDSTLNLLLVNVYRVKYNQNVTARGSMNS